MSRLVLYDLVGRDDRRFSPACWRTKLALAHKGMPFATVPARFCDIRRIHDGRFATLPVLRDGETWIADSDTIAAHLEEAHPDRPSLYAGAGGQALAAFMRAWVQARLHEPLIRMILPDIHDHLADAEDQAYFRASREARFGMPLEAVATGREARIEPFRIGLAPLRQVVAAQPFLGGKAPLYPDYMVLGAFQWARSISPSAGHLLAADDPLRAYLSRLTALYGGLAAKAVAYPL
jgi:glutathione S-transferase